MKRLTRIQKIVLSLSDDDFRELYRWMTELDQMKWDKEIEEDSKNGSNSYRKEQQHHNFFIFALDIIRIIILYTGYAQIGRTISECPAYFLHMDKMKLFLHSSECPMAFWEN